MARRIVWLLIAIAVARIVSTYWTLNHTMDEPSFISAGFEWLDNHTYAYMPEQPPLSHVTAAIGWLWARRLHGNLAAVAAVLLFTTLPTVLGHAGLATTDIAICAMLPAALYAFVLWLDKPGVSQTVWLALAVAGGVLSKFS